VFHCSVQIECYMCFTVLYKLSVTCVSLSVQSECYMCFTVLYKLSVIYVLLFCTIWVLCVSQFWTNWVLYVFHVSVQIECYMCFIVLYKFCSKQFHFIKYLLSNVRSALRNTHRCYCWQILIKTGSCQQIFVNSFTLDFLEIHFLYVDTYTAKLIANF